MVLPPLAMLPFHVTRHAVGSPAMLGLLRDLAETPKATSVILGATDILRGLCPSAHRSDPLCMSFVWVQSPSSSVFCIMFVSFVCALNDVCA